jgi:hypothetical protein
MNAQNINEIIKNIYLIRDEERKVNKPNTHAADMRKGFQNSHTACQQQQEVAMSPLMKNALHAFHDLKDDERLKTGSPQTKAEKWFHDSCETLLNKFNPSKTGKIYDTKTPIGSDLLYNTDCWDNLKDDMRDIQPGQAEERLKMTQTYGKPTKEVDIVRLLKHDTAFQKAVDVVCELLPSVKASEEFHEVNLPFMNKHTSVSYPWFQQDRNQVTPEIKAKYHVDTYAQLAMKVAKDTPLNDIYKWNVATAYGRNQRGKGRLIIAASRIPNLICNCLESVEIDAYKTKCSLFAGYNDAAYLKNVLTKMTEFCLKNNYVLANWDQHRYDVHVSKSWLELLGAVSMLKANGSRSKEIALKRAVLMTKTWLVNGMTGNLEEIYGRIFSGIIDTNRGGGIINAIITTYCLMKQDPQYTDIIYRAPWYMLVMGDDNLFIYNPAKFDKDRYVKDMSLLGFEVNPEKQQYGTFFLQNRVWRSGNEWIMAYPWTRVLRSMLFKETSKGLGPYGWVLAEAQQLYKLVEAPIFLKCVVNLLAPFDELRLGIGLPVEYILDQVKKEDAKAMAENKRKVSTAESLYDGDPTKASQFNEDGSFNASYLQQVFKVINDAYDPDFLKANGVQVPLEVTKYMTSKTA